MAGHHQTRFIDFFRLLDMGFTEEIEQIVAMTPKSRQTLLYSATMTDAVDQLVKLSLK